MFVYFPYIYIYSYMYFLIIKPFIMFYITYISLSITCLSITILYLLAIKCIIKQIHWDFIYILSACTVIWHNNSILKLFSYLPIFFYMLASFVIEQSPWVVWGYLDWTRKAIIISLVLKMISIFGKFRNPLHFQILHLLEFDPSPLILFYYLTGWT